MGGSDSCRRHYSDDGRLRRPTVPDGSASLAEQIERSLLRPMYTAVRARASDSPGLYRKIENYVTRYLLACGRSASDALAAYERFLRRYMEDVSHFVATGCYPTQAPDGPIGRWEYDAALLLSVLVTEHRYRIMQLVAAHSDTAGRTAVVGVGAGLEVELLKPSGCELHGWDLSLSDAVARLHEDVFLHEAPFPEGASGRFDRIFLIELLEHVSEPYELLAQCAQALRPGGRIVLTTATNIPQFDHVINFPADHAQFRERVEMLGLGIVSEEDIPHRWVASHIDSRNRFFVLERP